ncbi:MAG: DUF421 domain-containing protein [Oscillospiraceae bacterium]|nr:DUF421 domain-containing protein [Oscillospiraceae bacterium]
MSVAFIRTIIIYFLVIAALRIMGKRQLGELQPSELVVTILVSNLATMSIEDSNIPLMGTVMPIFVLVSCEVLLSYFILKSPMTQKLIFGNPRIVVRNGVIDQKELRSLRWTVEDISEQLRAGGVFDISEVSMAIVETSGNLSVYQNYRSRPMSIEMDETRSGEDDPPMVMISDGKIVEDTLNYCGVDRKWLDDTLGQKQLVPKDVFIMTCNKKRSYTIMEKEGRK